MAAENLAERFDRMPTTSPRTRIQDAPAPARASKPAPAKSKAGKRPASKPAGTVGPWRRRLKRLLAGLVVAFFVLPPAQCLLLRWVDPPVTWTMLSRSAGHLLEHDALRLPAHTTVGLDTLPRHVPGAAIASEDRGFFGHHGFDLGSIRNAWQRYRTRPGAKLVGGSTISQQVARNAFLWQHRSWPRKGLEAWYTVWLELLVPKRRILEVYLNVAEMGPMVFGVEAAARHWYGKPASKLSAQEAARIVALLPSPRRWTPVTPHVQKRAAWILRAPVRLPRP